jgi:hypothetical protein
MRYFILKNESSLEVVGAPFEVQPDNSILWFENSFVKPIFDVYPNPTTVIEGATQEEIAEATKQEVPFEVPLWTMRNVMRKANIFDLIIGAINQLDEPLKTDALDYLEYGNYIERHSNTVLLIQQITQFTDSQVDTLFIDANNLKL